MDWVVANTWGDTIICNALSDTFVSLMDPTAFMGAEVVGRVETSPNKYFIHRIVGQYQLVYRDEDPAASRRIEHRIWPGLYDTSLSTIHTPGLMTDSRTANSRLWFNRIQQPAQLQQTPFASIDHPFWTHVDIKPKQVVDENRVPVWQLWNPSIVDVSFQHWVRLLVSPVK